MGDDVLAVDARALTKSYGRERGIIDVNLTIAPGEVLGLVGANGAGKTTFIRTLLDLIRPTSGSISVFGRSSRQDSVAVREMCTYLPGEFVLPPRLTGYQAVRRFTFARRDVASGSVDSLADRLDVDLSRKVGDLSKGNRQKLGLVLAFAPTAPLVVLDEPTSGLDPLLQRTFADLVSEAVGAGSAVLMSSHVMTEVEQIADRVALLKDGRVSVVDDVARLLAGSRRRGHVRAADRTDTADIASALGLIPSVSDVQSDDGVISFACRGSVDPIVKALAAFTVESLELAHVDLEDAFFSDGHDAVGGES